MQYCLYCLPTLWNTCRFHFTQDYYFCLIYSRCRYQFGVFLQPKGIHCPDLAQTNLALQLSAADKEVPCSGGRRATGPAVSALVIIVVTVLGRCVIG